MGYLVSAVPWIAAAERRWAGLAGHGWCDDGDVSGSAYFAGEPTEAKLWQEQRGDFWDVRLWVPCMPRDRVAWMYGRLPPRQLAQMCCEFHRARCGCAGALRIERHVGWDGG